MASRRRSRVPRRSSVLLTFALFHHLNVIVAHRVSRYLSPVDVHGRSVGGEKFLAISDEGPIVRGVSSGEEAGSDFSRRETTRGHRRRCIAAADCRGRDYRGTLRYHDSDATVSLLSRESVRNGVDLAYPAAIRVRPTETRSRAVGRPRRVKGALIVDGRAALPQLLARNLFAAPRRTT